MKPERNKIMPTSYHGKRSNVCGSSEKVFKRKENIPSTSNYCESMNFRCRKKSKVKGKPNSDVYEKNMEKVKEIMGDKDNTSFANENMSRNILNKTGKKRKRVLHQIQPLGLSRETNLNQSYGSNSITPRASNLRAVKESNNYSWADKIVKKSNLPSPPDEHTIQKEKKSGEANFEPVDDQEVIDAMLSSKSRPQAGYFLDFETRSTMEGKIIGGKRSESVDESELTTVLYSEEDLKRKMKKWQSARQTAKQKTKQKFSLGERSNVLKGKHMSKKHSHDHLPSGWFIKFSRSKPNQYYYCHNEYGTTWTHPAVRDLKLDPKKYLNSSKKKKLDDVFPHVEALPEPAALSPIKTEMRNSKQKKFSSSEKKEKCDQKKLKKRYKHTCNADEFTSDVNDREDFKDFDYYSKNFRSRSLVESNKRRGRKKHRTSGEALCSLQTLFII